MDSVSLIILLGLPGAGKTTQASLLYKLLKKRNYKPLYVDVGYISPITRPLWSLCNRLWKTVIGPTIQNYRQELIAEMIVRSFKHKIKVLIILLSVLNIISQLVFANIVKLLNIVQHYILLAEGYTIDGILCTIYEGFMLKMPQNLKKIVYRIIFKTLLVLSAYSIVIILDYPPELVDKRRMDSENPYSFQIHYLRVYRKMYHMLLRSMYPIMDFIIVRTDKGSVINTFRTIVRFVRRRLAC